MARRTLARRSHGGRAPAARATLRGDRVGELSTALWLARTVEDAMSVLVLEAGQALGASSAVAYVLRGDTLELESAMGRAEDAHEWLRSVSSEAEIPVARAIREGRPGFYESRAALAAAFPGWTARVPHAGRFGALAALPLRLGEVTLGALGLAFDEEQVFAPEERALLSAVAAEGGVALHRARLLQARRAAPGRGDR